MASGGATRRHGRVSRRRAGFACVLWLSALAAGGCGDDAEAARQAREEISASLAAAREAAPQWDLLTVRPGAVPPGRHIELRYDEEVDRGLDYWLDSHDGEGWQRRYHAVAASADLPESGGPRTSPADLPQDVPSVLIRGPGPDVVAVPPGAPTGRWRVCPTAHPNLCAEFEVERR